MNQLISKVFTFLQLLLLDGKKRGGIYASSFYLILLPLKHSEIQHTTTVYTKLSLDSQVSRELNLHTHTHRVMVGED